MGFTEEIAEHVRKYAPEFGVSVISPIVAQAILESNHGNSELAKNANNFFGLKYRKGRCPSSNGIYNKIGSEQNADGSYSSWEMQWCKFPDMETGVRGYFEYTSIDRYKKARSAKTPEEYVKEIKAAGYATSLKYVENVLRVINDYNLRRFDFGANVAQENSPLVNVTILSPNHSGKRTSRICRITPHVVVGQLSAEAIGYCFDSSADQASCNYGIGTDGRVVMCVEEKNRSWCSSNRDNDQKAVTIECASDKTHPYAVNDVVYGKLIDLCTDICKRNGISKLLWLGGRDKTLAYSPKEDEAVLTAHRWFKNKACPGDHLYSLFGNIAETVTQRLNGTLPEKPEQEEPKEAKLYRVQVGAFSNKQNAERLVAELRLKGYDAIIK